MDKREAWKGISRNFGFDQNMHHSFFGIRHEDIIEDEFNFMMMLYRYFFVIAGVITGSNLIARSPSYGYGEGSRRAIKKLIE